MSLSANVSTLLGLVEIISGQSASMLALKSITDALRQERFYHTIIYMSNEDPSAEHTHYNSDHILKMLSTPNATPVYRFSAAYSKSLWDVNNREYLAIVRLDCVLDRDELLLQSLWRSLFRNRQSRLVLLFENSAPAAYVERMLKYCAHHNAFNVIALQPAALDAKLYQTLSIFPQPEVRTLPVQPHYRNLFPNHVRNMHGHPISIVTSKFIPIVFFYNDTAGRTTLSGYAGKVFAEYAHRHNATLVYPLMKSYDDVHLLGFTDNSVENFSVEMSALPSFYNPARNVSFTSHFHMINYCLMVPVERSLPGYLFYFIIFDANTVGLCLTGIVMVSLLFAVAARLQGIPRPLVHFIFNAYVFNAFLGQSFEMEAHFRGLKRGLYVIVAVAGLILNTSYVAYLQTFKTQAPLEAPYADVKDMVDRGITIAMQVDQLKTVMRRAKTFDFGENARYVTPVDNITDFNDLVEKLDTRYAYSTSNWFLHEEQQKFFTRPRFRLTEMCIAKDLGTMFLLQQNSPYLPSMNALIGGLVQGGLVQHWKEHVFIELLQMGKLKLSDPTERRSFKPLTLEDLSLVLALMLIAELTIICVFLLELYWPRCKGLRRTTAE